MSEASNECRYLLANEPGESKRLNQQQELFESVCAPRSFIHTDKINLGKVENVLDIATGTGIWLLNLRNQGQEGASLPQGAQLVGCDLSLENVDEAAKTSGIRFYVHDVLDPFPPEELGKYDLVQMRLVMSAMNSDTYLKAIRNIFEVLKPGGTIQLVEFDPRPPSCSKPIECFLRNMLNDLWTSSNKDPHRVCLDMEAHLNTVGFDDITLQRGKWPFGAVSTQMGLSLDKALKSAANAVSATKAMRKSIIQFQAGGIRTEKDFDNWFQEIEDFFFKEGYLCDMYIGTATKPINFKK